MWSITILVRLHLEAVFLVIFISVFSFVIHKLFDPFCRLMSGFLFVLKMFKREIFLFSKLFIRMYEHARFFFRICVGMRTWLFHVAEMSTFEVINWINEQKLKPRKKKCFKWMTLALEMDCCLWARSWTEKRKIKIYKVNKKIFKKQKTQRSKSNSHFINLFRCKT